MILFHGTLTFNFQFFRTYDALIHVFFGAHYAQNWWDPWEPRWYTGFFLVSYPPLSHYLIAFASKIVGLKLAFAPVQMFALLQLTVGMYRFSRLLVPSRAAGFACILLALSSSICETVQVFGQLPTTLSLGFLLNAIPWVWAYIKTGRWGYLLKAAVWMGSTTAAHHVTTLFGSVFFIGPMIAILVLEGFRMPRPGEALGKGIKEQIRRRVFRVMPRLYRTGIFGVVAVMALVLVVLPYWLWSKSDPIAQVPIPHGSRANFLKELNMGLMFWLIPWASTIWFFPYAMYKGLNWRWPVAASLFLLFVLGTGGTTPIPKMLLRGAFDILTLDRFTFWATMLILPFAGQALESLTWGRAGAWLTANFGNRIRMALLGSGLVSMLVIAIAISNLTQYRKFQPEYINVAPIVSFIDKDEHWRYRYLTLGFGDQMAWLSANTKGLTPDGNYHSARRLPELTTTPVERLEGAKYTGVPGIGSLQQFLTYPEKYNLKFIYSNDAFYDPMLYFYGWHRLGQLENGIRVWEREDIPPLPERLPRKQLPVLHRLLWGTLPVALPVFALISLFVAPFASRRWWFLRAWPLSRVYKLVQEDSLPPEPSSPWQPWQRFMRPLGQILSFTRRSTRNRLLRTGLVLVAVLGVAGLAWKTIQAPKTPEAAVIAYWDHLDFKRFGKAWLWITPKDGLTEERWRLDLSVQGGLRTGYAKLESIEPQRIAYQGDPKHPKVGDQALVRVYLTWFTSLHNIQDTYEQVLELTSKGWRITARPLLKVRPSERFQSVPGVDYFRAARRLTTDTTAAGEVIDRPVLRLRTARLVAYDRDPYPTGPSRVRLAIIGEVENIDARPADLTITGILRDKDGLEITRNNARDLVLHKILPGERTPFRIDFDGVSDPTDATKVVSFEVATKGVITQRDLERDLALWASLKAHVFEIRLDNIGVHEATIPQVLLSLYDPQGLAWLDGIYGMEAVPPRETRTLRMPTALPQGYRVLQILRDPNPSPNLLERLQPGIPPDTLSLKILGAVAYRLQARAFYREE